MFNANKSFTKLYAEIKFADQKLLTSWMTPLTQMLIRKDCRHKCERINLCFKFGNLVRGAAKQLCTCCCCWMIKVLCCMNTCQLNHAVRLAVAWAVDKQPGLATRPWVREKDFRQLRHYQCQTAFMRGYSLVTGQVLETSVRVENVNTTMTRQAKLMAATKRPCDPLFFMLQASGESKMLNATCRSLKMMQGLFTLFESFIIV